MNEKKYRLLTRGDFDGIVCAVLLKELNLIEDVLFVHPKDLQDGIIPISALDIITNLPYHENAYLVFEHHSSELLRTKGVKDNLIINKNAASCAQLIYDYFGGKHKFKNIPLELIKAVNKADSAHFFKSDVLRPQKWDLLSFIMDPRTGLGRFKHFKVANQDMLLHLIEYCRFYPASRILKMPDIEDRVNLYFEHQEVFKKQLQVCAKIINKKIILLDYRNEIIIYAGNRFVVYALYPKCNLSIQLINSFDLEKVIFAIGKSIFNKSSRINIGELCLKYGGGGHENAGTCQIPKEQAEAVLVEILSFINTQ
jgi:nanoRNase/pAp phosphatase (c-di-AMP/oligoRNAs hydrolase)